MRRMDRAVTDPQEIVGIMSRCEVLHLAINTDGAPYLLPVNFGMEPDGMTLYIHGAVNGTKYDLIEKDNRVGFEMDCHHGFVLDENDHSCTIDYESVMGWGTIEELAEEGEKHHALRLLMGQYHAADFLVDMGPLPRTRILCLRIQERTAKRRRKL